MNFRTSLRELYFKNDRITSRFYHMLFGFPIHLSFRINARSIKKFLGNENEGMILDAGCGEGLNSVNLAIQGYDVVGVDISIQPIKTAKHVSDSMKSKNKPLFLVSDIVKLPFRNNIFDIILCSEVLEHINEDEKALIEFRKVLKDGGRLIITVPQKKQKRYFLKKHFKELIPEHIREGYSIEDLKFLLRKTSFEVLKFERKFKFFGSIAWEFSNVIGDKWFMFPILYIFSFLDLLIPGRGNGLILLAKKTRL